MGLSQGVSKNFLTNSPTDPLYVQDVGGGAGPQDVDVVSTVGLTNTQLRATPVPVALDAPTLAALESINVQNTVSVQATDFDIRNLNSAQDSVTVTGSVIQSAQLVPAVYNQIDLVYTGTNVTTVTYKQAGVTVATLTLSYTGDNLTSVVRT